MGWVAPIKDDETLERFKQALRKVDDKYYIMFQIGIGTGMALQEILKLKNKDVKGKSSISVSIGAREIVTTYEFSEEDQKIIDELVKDKDPDGYLILGHTNSTAPLSREQAYRVFKAVGQSVGISAIGAQTMRKTYAWRYYKSTGDITYLQHMFNHASPAITYRYIGEKPNIQVVLRKNTAEENERSRYLLYLNDTGRKRLTAAIDELAAIRNKFDDPTNNDSFYGCVDCFLEELDGLIENYKQSLPDNE
ncbi:MAG: tyrosine-type recombinase/integrase [Lachnospiraceae bacterium]|jgi:integrase|nr:tyrosine-type recombinase/integrase [Lachnospiraceae bacterium]